MSKYSNEMHTGLEVAEKVTPSVIALAREAEVSANDLASAIVDDEANALYRNDLAHALQRAFVARAVEREKEENGSTANDNGSRRRGRPARG